MSEALAILLQLSDSQFPSGAFAHSGGLEALLEGRERLADDELVRLVGDLLEHQVLRCDSLFGVLAHRATVARRLDEIVDLDHELRARKLPRELREASAAIGRSFVEEAAAILPDPLLESFRERAAAGETPGNHAIGFHVAAAIARVPEVDTATAFAFQTCSQAASATVRLGLVGHRQAQRLLVRLREGVRRGLDETLGLARAEASGFAPLLEIASIRHERQYSRLFRS